ncbi:MAG: CvpA family protein [Planctomycetia bacterium]|nr:CvpA family protein [Planctomycetia bacterium]
MSICDGFDLAVLGMLFFGTLSGFFAGFWALFSWWLSFFLGIWVARSATPAILAIFPSPHPMAGGILAFFLFVLTFLLISALGKRCQRLLNHISFPLGNSLLGMVLGFTGSLLLAGVIVWGVVVVEEFRPMAAWSRSAKYFTALAQQFPASESWEKDFVARLNPENLPPEADFPTLPPPPSENNPSSPFFHWTWQLPEGVEGNRLHQFLNRLDTRLQSFLFQAPKSPR